MSPTRSPHPPSLPGVLHLHPLTPEGVGWARQSPAPAYSLAGGRGAHLTTCGPSEAQGSPHSPSDSLRREP